MNNTLRSLLKMFFFLTFGLLVLWLLYRNLNSSYLEECALKGIPASECSLLLKVYEDFQATKVVWLIIICICFFISNLSRARRWQQLLLSMGYQTRWGNAFHCVMLAYFANLGLPRLGEVVRAGTMAKYEVIPFEKVMGTVAVDRIIDLMCLILVFLLALALQYDLLWSYLMEHSRVGSGQGINPLYLSASVGLLILLIFLYRIRKSLMKYGIVKKLAGILKGFLEGLRSLQKVSNKTELILHSLIIWFMYFLMTYLCFKAFEPTAGLSPVAGLMIFVFGSLGMIIPTPGGMGSYHALVIAGLALYGINQNDAFSFAMIIFFTVNIFGNILFGILALFLLPGYNRAYQPVRT